MYYFSGSIKNDIQYSHSSYQLFTGRTTTKKNWKTDEKKTEQEDEKKQNHFLWSIHIYPEAFSSIIISNKSYESYLHINKKD